MQILSKIKKNISKGILQMTVICWDGMPRTGKTLNMIWYAYNNQLNKQMETICNLLLGWEHKRMDVYDMLKIPFDDVERNPKQLIIQEADKWFDSWLKNNENRLLSSLTGQSGKRNLDILYDTQFYSRIQKSLRKVTDYKVICSCYIDQYKRPLAFEIQWTQQAEFDVFIPISTPKIIPAPLMRPFYSMYNSYESTKPLVESRTIDDIAHGTKTIKHKRN